jgi:hypothetical protein
MNPLPSHFQSRKRFNDKVDQNRKTKRVKTFFSEVPTLGAKSLTTGKSQNLFSTLCNNINCANTNNNDNDGDGGESCDEDNVAMLQNVDADRRSDFRRLRRVRDVVDGRRLRVAAQLPVQSSHESGQHQRLSVRLGGGRLQQQDLHQGSG